MSARPRTALSAVATTLAGVLIVAGCSSNGSASVSQSQVEAKLKKDSNVKSLLSSLPSSVKGKDDAIISCIAKALKKDADGSDLDDYVNGSGSLNDIGGDKDKAESDLKSCVTSVVGG